MNAEMLLMFVLDSDRAYLYAHPEHELTADEQARYDEAIAERSTGKPAQYITGHQEFWGLDLIVSPAVLIPRPETEHVIETALELARGKPAPRIVDVGTGSGCIALALAMEMPWARVEAVDISPAALQVARANAHRLQLDHRIIFQQRDLLAGAPATPTISPSPILPMFLSRSRKRRSASARIRAQGGGVRGERAQVYCRLAPQARAALKPGGWLVVEIGFSLAAAVHELVNDWAGVRLRRTCRDSAGGRGEKIVASEQTQVHSMDSAVGPAREYNFKIRTLLPRRLFRRLDLLDIHKRGRILARVTGGAVVRFASRRRRPHPFQRQIGQRIGADELADLFDRFVGRDELLLRGVSTP